MIRRDRTRIDRGERPRYHVTLTTSREGVVDVRMREIPLIHLFVPDRARALDGARLLVARTLAVDPAAFEVAVDAGQGPT